MPQRSQFTLIEKKAMVEKCLAGKESICGCAAKQGVPVVTLRGWIRLYKTRGAEGLNPVVSTRKYPPEVKRLAVQEYLSGYGSQEEICIKHDISDCTMLRRWIACYTGHGDFKQPNSGGAVYMAKGRKTTLEERIEIASDCIANNKDYGKTIEQYGVSYQQIYGWVRKYESSGVEGLADRRGHRRDEASMSDLDKLRAPLKLKEAENLRLQMENELLKKLEALERGQDLD